MDNNEKYFVIDPTLDRCQLRITSNLIIECGNNPQLAIIKGLNKFCKENDFDINEISHLNYKVGLINPLSLYTIPPINIDDKLIDGFVIDFMFKHKNNG